jgi:hypothetical protein
MGYKQARRLSREALYKTLQKHWDQLLATQKVTVLLQGRYLQQEKIWSDQVGLWLDQMAALREPLTAIDAKLAKSEYLPEGLAIIRYPLLQAIHHYESQVDGLILFLASYQTRLLEAAALLDARQRIEDLKKGWEPVKRKYQMVITWLEVSPGSQIMKEEKG